MARLASPFDQLLVAIHQLPREQKIKLWRILDAELVSRDVDQELDQALRAIWASNPEVTEDESMADALAAIREYRASTSARRA
jgi:hypothetical protein